MSANIYTQVTINGQEQRFSNNIGPYSFPARRSSTSITRINDDDGITVTKYYSSGPRYSAFTEGLPYPISHSIPTPYQQGFIWASGYTGFCPAVHR